MFEERVRPIDNEIRLATGSLTLCDVRCGPTEDKQAVQLVSGVYVIDVDTSEGSVSVTIRRNDVEHPSPGADLGTLSIDGGVLGAYDTALYSEIFGDDAETFYDWGDALFEASDAVRVYGQAIAPYEFACVPTSLDAEFSLTELTDGDRRVGVRLQASIPDDQATGTFIAFQFLLADPSARIEIWLDPVYDDESILDCVVDELGEAMGHDVSLAEAMRFIARIESIEHAVQIDEDLAPSRVVDLPIDPADWKSDGARFCEYLRRVMTDASKPVR